MEKKSHPDETHSHNALHTSFQGLTFTNANHSQNMAAMPRQFNERSEGITNTKPPRPPELKLSSSGKKEVGNTMERAKKSSSNAIKTPAASFLATLLTIGKYNFVPEYHGDLVVKFQFLRRKFFWEILDRIKNKKFRVEVPWDEILSIRAVLDANGPEILEIELQKEPRLYDEIDTKPQKHTVWNLSQGDFTGGHSKTSRIHHLEFHHGVLGKHYQKMLQSDKRLLELSRQPFPRLKSPYFGPPVSHEDKIHHFNSVRQDHPNGLEITNSISPQPQPASVFMNSTQQEEKFLNAMPPSSQQMCSNPLALDNNCSYNANILTSAQQPGQLFNATLTPSSSLHMYSNPPASNSYHNPIFLCEEDDICNNTRDLEPAALVQNSTQQAEKLLNEVPPPSSSSLMYSNPSALNNNYYSNNPFLLYEGGQMSNTSNLVEVEAGTSYGQQGQYDITSNNGNIDYMQGVVSNEEDQAIFNTQMLPPNQVTNGNSMNYLPQPQASNFINLVSEAEPPGKWIYRGGK